MNLQILVWASLVGWLFYGPAVWGQGPIPKRPVAIVASFKPLNWELRESDQAEEVTLSAFALSDSDVPGQLRFELKVLELKRKGASLRVSVGEGPEVQITTESLGAYAIGEDRIEIPYSKPGRIRIARAGYAPAMVLLGIVQPPVSMRPEFKFSQTGPKFFDGDFQNDAHRRSLSLAIARLDFDVKDEGVASCTAFQFAPGLFLTNLHCVKNELRANDGRRGNTLVFGATKEMPHGVVKVSATFLGPNALTGDDPPDYAVLRADGVIPSPYDAAILQFATATETAELRTGMLLELYQQWTFEESGGGVGKALSDSAECVAYFADTGSSGLCKLPSLMHRCDSELGTSGSPVLRRGGDRVVALHFAGVSRRIGNCAIGISAVVEDMKRDSQLRVVLRHVLGNN